ncbi:MAG TPA: hypothetical protein PKA66_06305 [Gemmatimonadales bacterium]|nr:hypothetical protein [Gemmatimonadales bacterium]
MLRRFLVPVAALLLAVGVGTGTAQDRAPAHEADVRSIDSIITALYAVISGPIGEPRQWDRFHSLMHPDARLIPTGCDTAGACRLRIMTPAEYQSRADSFLVASGFTERELHRTVERYGAIAHAFSSYASFRGTEPTPFARGINSIQLFWDGTRWWVLSVFWDAERPSNPLPSSFE